MKIVFSVLLFLFSIVSIASAEVIDVNIKGVDDGIKTSRQQDYREAVMNAKLQAIEQSGASIESITKVVNFQLKYDAIESKSSAILLPGFQIIDIGYVADGTYQVVLIGKIQVGGKATQAREIGRHGSFIAYDNGTVLDTNTNLMWAAKDNGSNINRANAKSYESNINWANAKSYCENYRGGGYTDWRMPTQDELAWLYDGSIAGKNDHHLTTLITLTSYCPWASETRGSDAAYFHFYTGKRVWHSQSYSNHMRALPVRSGK
jgi:hypothetical protein